MTKSTHWLMTVARRAGWLEREPNIGTVATAEAAWRALAQSALRGDDQIAALLAQQFHLVRARLDAPDRNALRLVPAALARRYHVFPLRETNREITVATADPTDSDAEQMIAFSAGRRAVFEVATPAEIRELIDEHYGPEQREGRQVELVEANGPEAVQLTEVHDAPVINITNDIIRAAIEQRASDIHMGPGPGGAVVKFRIDGILKQHSELPVQVLSRVISRIKVLAGMDIADRVRPQDGRARVRIEDESYDLRISSVPARDAEKAVIRILRPQGSKRLEAMGLLPEDLAAIRQLLMHRHGLIVVTGPTGSGKTTSLYGMIRELAAQAINITTVEDPVEYEMPQITQIQVESKRDVTFASALRSILRQDPDVILVGEIRDVETAEIAVKAAMTGHLVLTTLHTNDAVSAVARLNEIGIEFSSIATVLRGVIAQRLVRCSCKACGGTGINGAAANAGRPCRTCQGSGYFERTPVLEVLACRGAVSEQIAQGASSEVLRRAAEQEGFNAMAAGARKLVQLGLTTATEVERVLGEAAEPESSATEPESPRALVVDDDPVLRLLASTVLSTSGFTVLQSQNGKEALATLSNTSVDVVISDYKMPELDGLGLLTHLRADARLHALPVIVMTAADDEATEIALMDAGASDYVRKPLEPARFVARVRAALRRSQVA